MTAWGKLIPAPPRAPAALKAAADTSTSQVTQTVRAGIECGDATGCVIPPLHLSSTFAFRGFADKGAYDYTRSGNPTRDLLGAALAELERGAGAVVTASGMAAVTLVGYLVPALGRIVAPHDCYGGTYRLFDAWRRRGERQVEFVDFGDEAAVRAALTAPAGLLWIETPSNPLLRITDIARFAALGRAAGALIVVDNTFLSPAWQQPLALGADLVVHSTTKYLNGHSDVVGGAVVARDKGVHEQLVWWANCLGLTGAPFDRDRKSTRLNSSHSQIPYAVFCLKKKDNRLGSGFTDPLPHRPHPRRFCSAGRRPPVEDARRGRYVEPPPPVPDRAHHRLYVPAD